MKKNIVKIMLSLLLGSTYILNPISMTNMSAEEKSAFVTPAAEFAMGRMEAINNGEGAFTGGTDLINRMKDADDFTLNVNVKLTGTAAAETLFFLGDSTKEDNYVLIYVTPNQTVGIEARNANNRPLNVVKDTGINLKDGGIHTITFTQKKGEYYRFYVDGNVVLDGMAASSFCKGLIANPTFLGIGTGKRLSYGNYPYTGELGSVQIFDSAITENQIQAYHKGITGEGDIAFETANAYFNKDAVYESSSSADLASMIAMDSGAITVRYQASSASSSAMSLFSISDSTQPNNYLSFYVNPSENSLGVKLSSSSKVEDLVMNNAILETHNVSVQNTEWHTLTVVKSSASVGDMGRRYTFYADGKLLNMYSDRDGFLNNITSADAVSVGFNNTSTESDKMKFTGSIDNLIVYKKFLDEEEAKRQHTIGYTSSEVLDMTNAMRKDYDNLFYPGYHDSADYRIPTVIETIEGTIITAVDKRNSGSGDNGNIDTAIRRKEAGSDTFSDLETVLDLIDNKGSTPVAFAIDPTMLQDKNTGRIFMLVDMFPESKGMVDPSIISPGSGYKKIDGVDYQLLYTADNQEYTIREHGVVYNANNEISPYRVITEGEAPFNEYGNLYKNGEYAGNIYLYSGADKGELHIVRAQYLWLLTSDDDGKTWSKPQDITPQVKQEWMNFIGVGPGGGLQLKDGTLTFPVYTASQANFSGSQASAMIRSSDGGETWVLGESPITLAGYNRETFNNSSAMLTESQAVQLENGQIKLFMRNPSGKVKVATSDDGGVNWSKLEQLDIYDPYCQMSVTHYVRDGKEYIVLLNPAGGTATSDHRLEGTLYLGEVNGSTITWTHDQLLAHGGFAYSSLISLGLDEHGDQKFGALYETDYYFGMCKVAYSEFDENFIKAGTVASTIANPKLISKQITTADNRVTISMTFDQTMMVAGHPALNLKVGKTIFKAAYKGGSATNTLKFEVDLSADLFGVVKAIGFDETDGIVENIKNGKADINFDVMDRTEVKFKGVTATSEQSNSTAPNTDGAAINVMDGNPNTYWHSKWDDANVTLPQSLTLDLGELKNIYKFAYLPRQGSESGHVLNFELYASETSDGEFTKVYSGMFVNSYAEQSIEFMPVNARYLRFVIHSSTAVKSSASVAEVRAFSYADGVFEHGDTTDLTAKIVTARKLLEHSGSYTETTEAALQQMVTYAQTIVAGFASQRIIDDTLHSLDKAIQGLIDGSKVKAALQIANDLDLNNYTVESWVPFSEIVMNVKKSYETVNTQREMTDLLMRLQYAQAQLIEKEIQKPDDLQICKDILSSAIRKAQELDDHHLLDHVNKKVLANFHMHLNVAIETYADKNATVETLLTAWMNLANIMQYLDFVADASQLNAKLDEYADIDLSLYVDDENKVEFTAAKQHALDVLENPNTLQDSLNTAFDRLVSAKSKLKLKVGEVDTTLIDFFINKGNMVVSNEIKYDTKAVSWSKFLTALAEAKTARDAKVSQSAVDTAAKKLSDAYEDIRLIANEDTLKELQSYLDVLDKINPLNYTKKANAYFKETKVVIQTMIQAKKFTMKQYEDVQQMMIHVEKYTETEKIDSSDANKPTISPKDPKQENTASSVLTGDTNQVGLLIGVFVVAGAVILVLFWRKHKKSDL